MKVNGYEMPDDLLYDDDYQWVKVEGDTATLGVIEFGLKQAGTIAFVELPFPGDTFEKGEEYCSLESGKWSGHKKMPCKAEIIEVNEKLVDDPELLNRDPYGEGWLVKIKILDKSGLDDLMTVEKAAEWLKKEIEKFK
ncbi:MAG TPA: glycine cleavage system protein GcvH [Candidatus Altiarchaeales archaeon]|nr:glycine cleavage system protein GcvH [Candidatus Altiarchaeales archaeon]